MAHGPIRLFGKRCWALQLRLYDIPTQSEYLSCNQPQGWMPQKIWIFSGHRLNTSEYPWPRQNNIENDCSICVRLGKWFCIFLHTVPKCAMFRSWIEFKHPGDDLVSWHNESQLCQQPPMPQWTEVGDNWLEYVDVTVAGMPLRPKSLWRTNPSS